MLYSCHFCGETNPDKITLPGIGIGFGISGQDMDFCEKCLKKLSAYDFWGKLAIEEGLSYPLKLK